MVLLELALARTTSALGLVSDCLKSSSLSNKHEQSCISLEILHFTSIFVVVSIAVTLMHNLHKSVVVECLHSAGLVFNVLSSGLAFNVLLLLLLHFTNT